MFIKFYVSSLTFFRIRGTESQHHTIFSKYSSNNQLRQRQQSYNHGGIASLNGKDDHAYTTTTSLIAMT